MHAFIISDVLPDIKYTGGQVLFKILENLPEFEFSIVWINQWNLPYSDSLPRNSKVTSAYDFEPSNFTKLLQRSIDRLGSIKIFRPVSIIFRGCVYYSRLLAISLKLCALIRLKNPDLVWMVLQGDKLAIIYKIIIFLNRDKIYLLHQWDPISWWLSSKKRPTWFIGLISSLVGGLEKKASLNIVPSKAWAHKLVRENKMAYAIDNFFEDASFIYPYTNYHNPGVLNVVFIGQRYADNELIDIGGVLRSFEVSCKCKVLVHYFGSSPLTDLAGVEVVSHGYLDPNQLVQEISIFDLALLPYPTDPQNKETVALSFPSKCRQYLISGLPILSLAPIESGVHQFLDQNLSHNAYFNIYQNSNPDNFIADITNLSFQNRQRLHSEIKDVARRNFSESTEMRPLQTMLNELLQL